MGITGLIPFLEKASKKGNISQFSGCTVAVDTYCWLHKGAFSCAEKIAMGQPTDAYVTYCLKFVNMLLANRIKPILVFDGCHLPAKAETEVKRRESRESNKRRAAELIKMGQTAEGRTLLRRSVDITHEMALQLMKKCHDMNVDCIVAPYEADAQLGYLNISGIADVVITEDSDLTLFGCKKIFFKMDLYGNGLLVEQDRLHVAMKLREDVFDIDKFRHMCILSGCDYLPSLPGIGLQKACKFVQKNIDPDIHRALCRLSSYLNMKSIVVTEDYRDAFIRALVTFKHQLVFCPLKRKQVRLTTPPPEVTPEQLYHAGEEKPHDLAWQLALGNYDPITLKKMHDYDPDLFLVNVKSRKNALDNQYVAGHVSIWCKDFTIKKEVKTEKVKTETTSWPNTLGKSMVLNTEGLKDQSSLKRSYEDMENDLTDNDIVKLYGDEKTEESKQLIEEESEMKEKERQESKEVNDMRTPPKKKSNPFLKKSLETSPCLIRDSKRRKPRTFIALEPTVVDDNNVVKSKYFSPDSKETEQRVIIPETQDEDLPLTQPDSYKENGAFNVYNIEDGLYRSDSGVDMKDESNDGKINSKDIVEGCQRLSPEMTELERLIDNKCDIACSQPNTSSLNDIADFSVNSSVNSVTSSFFKWANSKAAPGESINPISIRNSRRLQNQSSRGKSSGKLKKPAVAPQNLLNTYGFEKKTVMKH